MERRCFSREQEIETTPHGDSRFISGLGDEEEASTGSAKSAGGSSGSTRRSRFIVRKRGLGTLGPRESREWPNHASEPEPPSSKTSRPVGSAQPVARLS